MTNAVVVAVRQMAWAGLVFALTGCVNAQSLVSRDTLLERKVVTVGEQEITIGKAAGYCIRDRQSRYTADGVFVVMGPCAPEDEAAPKGLVVVNVLASDPFEGDMDPKNLDAFFKTPEGRTALSAKGDGSAVEVLGTMVSDGVYVVHSRDANGPVIPHTSDEQWRSFSMVSERLVSVSIISFTDSLMPAGQIFSQMEEIATTFRVLN